MKLIEVATASIDLLQKTSPDNASEAAANELGSVAIHATPERFMEVLRGCAADPTSIAGIANPRFGEPSLLLVESNDWVFEIIYWYDMVSAIHEHSYPGAFLAVAGRRLHFEFDYSPQSTVDHASRCDIGALTSCRTELLHSGEIRYIRPFENFIHAVWPSDTPCLTAVIRKKAPRRSRSYLPNSGGNCIRFDERVAEMEVVPRLRYLRSLSRWSGRFEMLLCVRDLSESLSASAVVYLLMTLEVGHSELYKAGVDSVLVRRFGSQFVDALSGCLKTDAAFRSLYFLRLHATTVEEQLALGMGFFGPLVQKEHLGLLATLVADPPA